MFSSTNGVVSCPEPEHRSTFLRDIGGDLAPLIFAHDWSATPLGPLDEWPACLRSAVDITLRCPLPVALMWGRDGVLIFNDGYATVAGSTYARKLGLRVRDAWPEATDFNAAVIDAVFAGGAPTFQDQPFELARNGRVERGWFDLNYSAVIGQNGRPAGVLAIVAETTERIHASERLAKERLCRGRMLQQMPGFAAFLAGPDHVYEFVNSAYTELSDRGEFIGRTVKEVFPELAGQGFLELLDKVYRSGEAHVARGAEIRLADDYESRYIDFVCQPVFDEKEAVTGIFVGGYEITETYRAVAALRASESRLRELNANRERKVIERSQAHGRIGK